MFFGEDSSIWMPTKSTQDHVIPTPRMAGFVGYRGTCPGRPRQLQKDNQEACKLAVAKHNLAAAGEVWSSRGHVQMAEVGNRIHPRNQHNLQIYTVMTKQPYTHEVRAELPDG